MARTKVRELGTRRSGARGEAIEPSETAATLSGLGVGVLEMSSGERWWVRLSTGELVAATLAPGVDAELAAECLADRRTVLLGPAPGGAVVLGALQTRRSVARVDAHGAATLAATELLLRADEGIALRVGGSSLRLDAEGALRIEGQRMTIDVAALLRVLSAKVELP